MGPGGPRFSAGPALLNASKSNQQYGAFGGNLKEGWGGRSRKRIGERGPVALRRNQPDAGRAKAVARGKPSELRWWSWKVYLSSAPGGLLLGLF
jgi:hypothetical protein